MASPISKSNCHDDYNTLGPTIELAKDPVFQEACEKLGYSPQEWKHYQAIGSHSDNGATRLRDNQNRAEAQNHSPVEEAAAYQNRKAKGASKSKIHSSGNSVTKDVVLKESILPFQTAAEFADKTSAEVSWAVEGFAAFGAVTELVGKIKASGKTTLALNLAAAILNQRHFLPNDGDSVGFATSHSGVIYLSEQPGISFREALRRAGLLTATDLHILFWHDVASKPWPDVVSDCIRLAKKTGARVLIIDTISWWAGLRGEQENNSGAALEAMAPLLEASGAHDMAVIVLRHERKGGGEVGDSGRGSSAFAGAADIVLSLKRREGQGSPNVRVIDSLSRFDETPSRLVVQLTPNGYISHGEKAAVAMKRAKELLLEIVPKDESNAMPTDALKAALLAGGVRGTTAGEAIKEMTATEDKPGFLGRIGGGAKGDPYRYYLLRDSIAA